MLQIEELTVELPHFVLGPINLKLQKGDYCVVLGPSGSGKSTFLETLIGLRRPKTGKIFLEGEDITDLPPEKRKITILYQDYLLFPHLNVFENVAFGLKKATKDKNRIKEEVLKVAKELRIEHLLDKNVNLLSGGEKQRVALARALVVRPKLLLLDEPLSALDPHSRSRIRELLKEAAQKHSITVIHVSHDLNDALNLGNKQLFLYKGKVFDAGPKERVINCPKHPLVANFLGLNLLKGVVKKVEKDHLKVRVENFTLKVTNWVGEPKEGCNVYIYFPPSAVHFTGENRIKGTVLKSLREGFLTVYLLKVEKWEIKFLCKDKTLIKTAEGTVEIGISPKEMCANFLFTEGENFIL